MYVRAVQYLLLLCRGVILYLSFSAQYICGLKSLCRVAVQYHASRSVMMCTIPSEYLSCFTVDHERSPFVSIPAAMYWFVVTGTTGSQSFASLILCVLSLTLAFIMAHSINVYVVITHTALHIFRNIIDHRTDYITHCILWAATYLSISGLW